MKSRITVEIDYDNNNQPVLQIISRDSDDVRDGLIKAFYQKLGGSSWCKIVFNQVFDGRDDFKRILITPIPDAYLLAEAHIMLEQDRVNQKFASDQAH